MRRPSEWGPPRDCGERSGTEREGLKGRAPWAPRLRFNFTRLTARAAEKQVTAGTFLVTTRYGTSSPTTPTTATSARTGTTRGTPKPATDPSSANSKHSGTTSPSNPPPNPPTAVSPQVACDIRALLFCALEGSGRCGPWPRTGPARAGLSPGRCARPRGSTRSATARSPVAGTRRIRAIAGQA
jgi:hypothetical protein